MAARSTHLRNNADFHKTSKLPRKLFHRRNVVWPCNAVVGIDLGTSNSTVATTLDGAPVVLPLDDDTGSCIVPSVVSFTPQGDILVGRSAEQLDDRANIFYSFKRLMGRRLKEVQDDAARLLYQVLEGDQGEALVYSSHADDVLSPIELSHYLLHYLITASEKVIGQRVHGAIITVPAHFRTQQKQATYEAAKLAGLSTVQLLQEPVAAALAYGINGGADGQTVLVVDMGGGTFDVSLLQAFEGILEVLGTAGDSQLGGDDIDVVLATWILKNVESIDKAWALKAAQKAKIDFSTGVSQVEILCPDGSQLSFQRQLMEELTAELFYRMAEVLTSLGRELFVEWSVEPHLAVPCNTIGEDRCASSPPAQPPDKWAAPPRRIDAVVLVGQSTLLPSVREFIAKTAGTLPESGVDPAEAVALGAAIQAGILMGQLGGVEIMDGSFVASQHGRNTGFTTWQP